MAVEEWDETGSDQELRNLQKRWTQPLRSPHLLYEPEKALFTLDEVDSPELLYHAQVFTRKDPPFSLPRWHLGFSF